MCRIRWLDSINRPYERIFFCLSYWLLTLQPWTVGLWPERQIYARGKLPESARSAGVEERVSKSLARLKAVAFLSPVMCVCVCVYRQKMSLRKHTTQLYQ